MDKLRFSVIIPAYNCAECIEQAVDSVIKQDFDSFELIIVNDGSTDNTAQVLSSLEKKDGRIKIVNSENSGPAKARMRGISVSCGEYVMFLDSDDRFSPDAFSTVSGLIDEYKADIVIFGFEQIFTSSGISDEHKFKSFYAENLSEIGSDFGALYRSDVLNQVWNKAFSRKMIVSNGIEFPDLRFGEDRIFTARCMKAADGICVTDKILYNYIIDSDVSLISGWYDKKFFACNEIYNEFISMCIDGESKKAVKYMYLKSVLSCLTVLYSRKCSLSPAQKKAQARAIVTSAEIARNLDCKMDSFPVEIIRRVLVSKNTAANILLAKCVVFAQDYMTSLFLKIKKQ